MQNRLTENSMGLVLPLELFVGDDHGVSAALLISNGTALRTDARRVAGAFCRGSHAGASSNRAEGVMVVDPQENACWREGGRRASGAGSVRPLRAYYRP